MRREDLQLLINQYDKSQKKTATDENIRIAWLKNFLEQNPDPNPSFGDFIDFLKKHHEAKETLATLFDLTYLEGTSDSAKIFNQFISADLHPKENKKEPIEPPKASDKSQTFFC